MAHSAQPDGPPHRTRDLILGVTALIIAVPVIIFLIFALRHPKGPHAANEVSSGATSSSPAASAGSTPVSTPVSTPTASTPTASASTAPLSTTPSTPTTPAATSPSNSVAPASVRLPVIVLNNTAATGAAALATSRLQAGGWQASDGGNFSGDILSTVAYYNPNADGSEAAAEALQQQFPAIRRVRPFIEGLPDAAVVVVLTSDYS